MHACTHALLTPLGAVILITPLGAGCTTLGLLKGILQKLVLKGKTMEFFEKLVLKGQGEQCSQRATAGRGQEVAQGIQASV